MNHFHDILRTLVLQHGPGVLTRRQLVYMFNDLAPQHIRQQFRRVLRQSVHDHIGQNLIELLNRHNTTIPETEIERITYQFKRQNLYLPELAEYVVKCYVYALTQQSAPPVPFNPPEEPDRADPGYHGQRRQQMRWGIGAHINDGDDCYAGQWSMNNPHGVGVRIGRHGIHYAGQWDAGKRHGRGLIVLPTGETFVATFHRGEIQHGTLGAFFAQDGSLVIGNMGSNGPEGPCLRFAPDGTRHQEMYRNGKRVNH